MHRGGAQKIIAVIGTNMTSRTPPGPFRLQGALSWLCSGAVDATRGSTSYPSLTTCALTPTSSSKRFSGGSAYTSPTPSQRQAGSGGGGRGGHRTAWPDGSVAAQGKSAGVGTGERCGARADGRGAASAGGPEAGPKLPTIAVGLGPGVVRARRVEQRTNERTAITPSLQGESFLSRGDPVVCARVVLYNERTNDENAKERHAGLHGACRRAVPHSSPR